jgi:hypothetical protein
LNLFATIQGCRIIQRSDGRFLSGKFLTEVRKKSKALASKIWGSFTKSSIYKKTMMQNTDKNVPMVCSDNNETAVTAPMMYAVVLYAFGPHVEQEARQTFAASSSGFRFEEVSADCVADTTTQGIVQQPDEEIKSLAVAVEEVTSTALTTTTATGDGQMVLHPKIHQVLLAILEHTKKLDEKNTVLSTKVDDLKAQVKSVRADTMKAVAKEMKIERENVQKLKYHICRSNALNGDKDELPRDSLAKRGYYQNKIDHHETRIGELKTWLKAKRKYTDRDLDKIEEDAQNNSVDRDDLEVEVTDSSEDEEDDDVPAAKKQRTEPAPARASAPASVSARAEEEAEAALPEFVPPHFEDDSAWSTRHLD